MINEAHPNLDSLVEDVFNASLIKGKFKLRSGEYSEYYFDKYLFESDPSMLDRSAALMKKQLPWNTDLIAGLDMGGIPLVTSIGLRASIPMRFVRKSPKHYGTEKIVEGGEVAGKNVTIIEDVITSGGAVIEAALALRGLGANVRFAICALDRQQGGSENLLKHDMILRPMITFDMFEKLIQAKQQS